MTKKILITGINGFIGASCATHFLSKGYEIFGIDLIGGKSFSFVQGEVNLANLKLLNQEFDLIIHLAGSGTVGAAQKNPDLEKIKTVGSTEQLLEYMRNFNKNAKLIYSSSAAVYGDLHDTPIKENTELNPISCYGEHKVEVEKLCGIYHLNYGLDINIIRFFSIYGEGLKKQLLWDFSNRLTKNLDLSAIPCFGTGEEQRDFIHISDAIQLIELLSERKDKFQILNCATGNSIKIKDILNLISNEFDYKGELVFDTILREGDPQFLMSDIAKARSMGFSPKITIVEGIKRYVNWFKENN